MSRHRCNWRRLMAGAGLGLAGLWAWPSGVLAQQVHPAAPHEQSPTALIQQHNGSLLKATLSAPPPSGQSGLLGISYFAVPKAEPKTIRKHDLVTIVIREQSEMSSDNNVDLKKDHSLDASIDEMIRLSGGRLKGGGVSDPKPSIRWGASREFKGEGSVDRTDRFQSRIQARVIDIKPNGTFAIQAQKRIKHDEEVAEYIMTGTCRAEDLTADNSIFSWQVHDLNIETRHKGALRDTTKRGWIPRLLDFANPF
jgi:flagellar L-ring protein FlgH